jgi:hypothetical protein
MLGYLLRWGVLGTCVFLMGGCHVALVPTEFGTAYDSTLGWPPGNTEMRGPRVAMRHTKGDLYDTLDTGLGAIERLGAIAAPLAAQGMQNRQALDLLEAQRTQAPRPAATPQASQPARFREMDLMPLSIPAIP